MLLRLTHSICERNCKNRNKSPDHLPTETPIVMYSQWEIRDRLLLPLSSPTPVPSSPEPNLSRAPRARSPATTAILSNWLITAKIRMYLGINLPRRGLLHRKVLGAILGRFRKPRFQMHHCLVCDTHNAPTNRTVNRRAWSGSRAVRATVVQRSGRCRARSIYRTG